MALPRSFIAYGIALCAAAFPLAGWAVHASWGAPVALPWLSILTLAAAVVINEFLPLHFRRHGKAWEDVRISALFVMALAVAAPMWLTVVVLAVALTASDLHGRLHWTRPLLNVAMFVLAVLAGRAVFSLLTSQSLHAGLSLRPGHLGALLLAVVVYLLSNHLLVGLAFALAGSQRLGATLTSDLLFDALSLCVVLSVTPLALVAAAFSPIVVLMTFLPITALHLVGRLAAQHEHKSLHDPLTGLSNRSGLHLRFQQLSYTADADALLPGLLLIDLDHFKHINDTLGHPAGDRLLQQVAERLTSAVRAVDAVARLGGDEFAVLVQVPRASARSAMESVAQKLSTALCQPTVLAGHPRDVSGSVGGAVGDRDMTLEFLTAQADLALYEAKEDRGSWRVHAPGPPRAPAPQPALS